MTLQRQISFWILSFIGVVLALYVLRGILLPFLAGLALAYFLDPLADRLQRLGLSRFLASLLILGVFLLIFVGALLLVAPKLGRDLSNFLDTMPATVAKLQELLAQHGAPYLSKLGQRFDPTELKGSLGEVISTGVSWIGSLLSSVWSGGQALVGIMSLLVVTPVVAFYLLNDWDRMIAKIDSWLPINHRDTIRMLASENNAAIAGFLRGQAAVCFILGSFYAVSLSLVGLNFGFLIGFTAGVLTFIPYIGSMTGLILSVGVAIVQFWPDWSMILVVLGIFVLGQTVEGNFLSPKLVGDAVGLHPVWLMFALFAFGSLFGFVGLLVAVPLAATMGVLARFALKQYLASPLYLGTGQGPAPGPRTDA
jgi:predicted PurR-regulated permease PerM